MKRSSRFNSPKGIRGDSNSKVVDEISNDNLYNNENTYNIKWDFEFDAKTEKYFDLFCYHFYNINGIAKILTILYIRLLSSRINDIKDLFIKSKIFHMLNVFHLISYIISIIISKKSIFKSDIVNVFIYLLFTINHCCHLFSIFYNLRKEYHIFVTVPCEIIFNYSILFFLNVKKVYFLCIISLVPLSSIISLYGIGSFILLLYLIIGVLFTFLLYFILKKAYREFWALFDSFKRSYYCLIQGLLESDPNPIFIISPQKITWYQNKSAILFANYFINNSNNKNSKKPTSNFSKMKGKSTELNLLDIVPQNLRESFDKLIDDVIKDKNVQSFYFPLCHKDNSNVKSLNLSTQNNNLFDGNYFDFLWFRVLVCQTEWKKQKAYYVSFFPTEEILTNQVFAIYIKKMVFYLEQTVSNCDVIYATLMNGEKLTNKLLKLFKTPKLKNSTTSLTKTVRTPLSDNTASADTSPLKTPNSQNIIDVELNKILIYFFKSQFELTYDYFTTLEVYFTYIHKKDSYLRNVELSRKELSCIEVKNILEYYYEYFYNLFDEHNCSLEFDLKDEGIKYILIEQKYLRIIMFNIFFFLVCFLDDKNKDKKNTKSISVTLHLEKKTRIDKILNIENLSSCKLNLDKKLFSYNINEEDIDEGNLKFHFTLFSGNKNINLSKILKIIQEENVNSQLKTEFLKIKHLDIGIITVYQILKRYYKQNLNMSSTDEGDHEISFVIPCKIISEFNTSYIRTPRAIMTPSGRTTIPSSNDTSPLFGNKNVVKAKNLFTFSNYYNKKVLQILYGIEKISILRNKSDDSLDRFVIPKFKKIEQKSLKNQENSFKFNSSSRLREEYFNYKKKGSLFKLYKIEEDLSKEFKKDILIHIIKKVNSKEFITHLEEEMKENYQLKIYSDLNEAKSNSDKNINKNNFNMFFINLTDKNEINFAEKLKLNSNSDYLKIYGYFFGITSKCKERANVKFEREFNLSLGYDAVNMLLK